MNKWLILLAAVAITGGSYYLLSQAKGTNLPNVPASSALEVEDFDTPEDAADTDKTDGSLDMLDDQEGLARQVDPTAPKDGAKDASRAAHNPADIETIDDADDPGETVKDRILQEDKSEPPEAQPAR